MKIPVDAVYEGRGILRLKQPVSLREQASVRVTIEEAEVQEPATAERPEPADWKKAAELIGCIIEPPAAPAISEEHDEVLYR